MSVVLATRWHRHSCLCSYSLESTACLANCTVRSACATSLRKPVAEKIGCTRSSGWIDICQHDDHISRRWIDAQLPVHAGRAASVTERSHSPFGLVHETVGVLFAIMDLRMARREQF